MSKRLDKIRRNWSDSDLMSLPDVPSDILPDTVFEAVVSADPTPQKKMVEWLLNSWRNEGLLWEDIEQGHNSKTAKTLLDFERLKTKIVKGDGTPDIPARSLMKYRGPGELWKAIRPFLEQEEESGLSISGKEEKRLDMMKARMETCSTTLDSGVRVDIPMTRYASCTLGHNTKWCTAARDNNYFKSYAENGPLMIFTLPDGTRFQGHVTISEEGRGIRHTINDFHLSNMEIMNEREVLDRLRLRQYFVFLDEADTALDDEEHKKIEPFIEDISSFISRAVTRISKCRSTDIEQILSGGIKEYIQQSRRIVHRPSRSNNSSEEIIDVSQRLMENGLLGKDDEGLHFIKPEGHKWREFFADSITTAMEHLFLSRTELQKFWKELDNVVFRDTDIQEILDETSDVKYLHLVYNSKNIDNTIDILRKRNNWSRQDIVHAFGSDTLKISSLNTVFYGNSRITNIFERFPEIVDITNDNTRLFRDRWVHNQIPNGESADKVIKALMITVFSGSRDMSARSILEYYKASLTEALSPGMNATQKRIFGDLAIPELFLTLKKAMESDPIPDGCPSHDTFVMVAIRHAVAEVSQKEYRLDMKDIDHLFKECLLEDIVHAAQKTFTGQAQETQWAVDCMGYLLAFNEEISNAVPKFKREYRGVMTILSHDKEVGHSRNPELMDMTGNPVSQAIYDDYPISALLDNPCDIKKKKMEVMLSSLVGEPSRDYLQSIKTNDASGFNVFIQECKRNQNILDRLKPRMQADSQNTMFSDATSFLENQVKKSLVMQRARLAESKLSQHISSSIP